MTRSVDNCATASAGMPDKSAVSVIIVCPDTAAGNNQYSIGHLKLIKKVSSKPAPEKKIQRRKRGTERKREIATVAARLFADSGFSVSTRDISAQLNITQAALYKHFPSKNALIEEVFRIQYLDERPSEFASRLLHGKSGLEERLTYAYSEFLAEISKISMKLFHRASYDGLEIAKRYSPHLDKRILFPVIEELRIAAKLPATDKMRVSPDERELALMLHSAIVFLGIRKHVYNIDFKGGENDLVALNVKTWLAGALVVVHKLVKCN